MYYPEKPGGHPTPLEPTQHKRTTNFEHRAGAAGTNRADKAALAKKLAGGFPGQGELPGNKNVIFRDDSGELTLPERTERIEQIRARSVELTLHEHIEQIGPRSGEMALSGLFEQILPSTGSTDNLPGATRAFVVISHKGGVNPSLQVATSIEPTGGPHHDRPPTSPPRGGRRDQTEPQQSSCAPILPKAAQSSLRSMGVFAFGGKGGDDASVLAALKAHVAPADDRDTQTLDEALQAAVRHGPTISKLDAKSVKLTRQAGR